MKTVTCTTKAWIPGHSSIGPDDLQNPNKLDQLSFTSADMQAAGWTYVGTATLEVEIPDVQALVESKVSALKNELANIRAEAEMKATQIQGRINDLLAISYEPADAA